MHVPMAQQSKPAGGQASVSQRIITVDIRETAVRDVPGYASDRMPSRLSEHRGKPGTADPESAGHLRSGGGEKGRRGCCVYISEECWLSVSCFLRSATGVIFSKFWGKTGSKQSRDGGRRRDVSSVWTEGARRNREGFAAVFDQSFSFFFFLSLLVSPVDIMTVLKNWKLPTTWK
jgi:hypothetical protein